MKAHDLAPARSRRTASLRFCLGAAMLGIVALLGGCYVPNHAQHALLEISDAGGYTLQGTPIEPRDLAARTQAVVQPGTVVEIRASASAPLSAVTAGVAAVQASHARVAFVGATAAH